MDILPGVAGNTANDVLASQTPSPEVSSSGTSDNSLLPGIGGQKDIKDMLDQYVKENQDVYKKEHPQTAQELLDYLGNHLDDEASRDLFFQYLLGENSLNDAYKRELEADSNKYQRLVKDLKAAGINPMFVLNGATAGNISSQGSSYNSGYETRRYHKASEEISREQLKEQKRKNNMDFISSLFRVVTSAIGIAMMV